MTDIERAQHLVRQIAYWTRKTTDPLTFRNDPRGRRKLGRQIEQSRKALWNIYDKMPPQDLSRIQIAN